VTGANPASVAVLRRREIGVHGDGPIFLREIMPLDLEQNRQQNVKRILF